MFKLMRGDTHHQLFTGELQRRQELWGRPDDGNEGQRTVENVQGCSVLR